MNAVLAVPLRIDALFLEKDQPVHPSTADFSRLPYTTPNGDRNPEVAWLSEEIVPQPFEGAALWLKAGLHLHWRLPDTFLRGTNQGLIRLNASYAKDLDEKILPSRMCEDLLHYGISVSDHVTVRFRETTWQISHRSYRFKLSEYANARIENGQIGVFLCYVSPRGYVLLDRELYLPQNWVEDTDRCRAAGIPEETAFTTKPKLGKRMLERAFQAGMPCGWVAADEVYGHDSKLRRWLEEHRRPYVLSVSADQRLWRPDLRRQRVDEMAGELPRRAWKRLSAGHGAKGERLYDWALIPWGADEDWEHTLLIRRSLETKPEYAFYFTYARKEKSILKTLVAVAGRRWAIESAFQMAKSECGLDHYEVRHWKGWYRHITLAMLALAVLTVLRAREKKNLPQEGPAQRAGNPAFARFRAARRLAQPEASSSLV